MYCLLPTVKQNNHLKYISPKENLSSYAYLIAGLMLVISGVLYCIKTVTNQVVAVEEVNKNETYGR